MTKCRIEPTESDSDAQMQLIRELIQIGINPCARLEKSSEGYESLIQFAVANGQGPLVYELLKMGADLGYLDSEGNSLLHFACQIKDPTARKDIVGHIARHAPDLIDLRNHAGEIPVQHARGKKGISRLLSNIKKDVLEMQKTKEPPQSEDLGGSPPRGRIHTVRT